MDASTSSALRRPAVSWETEVAERRFDVVGDVNLSPVSFGKTLDLELSGYRRHQRNVPRKAKQELPPLPLDRRLERVVVASRTFPHVDQKRVLVAGDERQMTCNVTEAALDVTGVLESPRCPESHEQLASAVGVQVVVGLPSETVKCLARASSR